MRSIVAEFTPLSGIEPQLARFAPAHDCQHHGHRTTCPKNVDFALLKHEVLELPGENSHFARLISAILKLYFRLGKFAEREPALLKEIHVRECDG